VVLLVQLVMEHVLVVDSIHNLLRQLQQLATLQHQQQHLVVWLVLIQMLFHVQLHQFQRYAIMDII